MSGGGQRVALFLSFQFRSVFPMHVLLVIDHLSSGGAQGQMTMLACELAARGHQVEFFTYHHESFHAERLVRAGITIHKHPKKSRYSLGVIRALRRLLRSQRFDIVLSFLTTPNIYAVLARGSNPQPPVVISERSSADNPLLQQASWLKSLLNHRAYRRADHCCVNSHHLRESMSIQYGWGEDRISTIWNGVDLEQFPFRELPGGPELRLLAVGRIAAYKNATCLIRALHILRQRHDQRIEVSWLARRFPNLTPAEREHQQHLDSLLREYGLQSQWEWLPESHEVASILHRHHAVIHPSTVEGLPNVVCEALACGRPVLISDILDHPRLIDTDRGFRFDPHDPEALAARVAEFASLSNDQRQNLSRSARDFAERNLAKKRFVDQYEQLLERIVQQND